MRNHLRIAGFVLLGLLVLNTLVAFAQSGSFTLDNAAGIELDRDAVEGAARALINSYGADVAIYTVRSGNSRDFTGRLVDDGLAVTSTYTNTHTLAIYIATEEQYSEIRWGSRFDNLDGNGLRSGSLNPALRDRDFTTAFVDTLNAAAGQMSNPFAGLGRTLGPLLSSWQCWLVIIIVGFAFLSRAMGWSSGGGGGDGSYYDNDSSWGSSSGGHSSGGSSGSSGHSSGGGSSGGSWKD